MRIYFKVRTWSASAGSSGLSLYCLTEWLALESPQHSMLPPALPFEPLPICWIVRASTLSFPDINPILSDRWCKRNILSISRSFLCNIRLALILSLVIACLSSYSTFKFSYAITWPLLVWTVWPAHGNKGPHSTKRQTDRQTDRHFHKANLKCVQQTDRRADRVYDGQSLCLSVCLSVCLLAQWGPLPFGAVAVI